MQDLIAPDDSQIEKLERFKVQVRKTDVHVNSQFHKLIRAAQQLLDIHDKEFADALFASRPTVNRWVNGKNLPHLSTRKHAQTWISRQVAEKIKRMKLFDSRRDLESANVEKWERKKLAAG